jgi:hypothetical protein
MTSVPLEEEGVAIYSPKISCHCIVAGPKYPELVYPQGIFHPPHFGRPEPLWLGWFDQRLICLGWSDNYDQYSEQELETAIFGRNWPRLGSEQSSEAGNATTRNLRLFLHHLLRYKHKNLKTYKIRLRVDYGLRC